MKASRHVHRAHLAFGIPSSPSALDARDARPKPLSRRGRSGRTARRRSCSRRDTATQGGVRIPGRLPPSHVLVASGRPSTPVDAGPWKRAPFHSCDWYNDPAVTSRRARHRSRVRRGKPDGDGPAPGSSRVDPGRTRGGRRWSDSARRVFAARSVAEGTLDRSGRALHLHRVGAGRQRRDRRAVGRAARNRSAPRCLDRLGLRLSLARAAPSATVAAAVRFGLFLRHRRVDRDGAAVDPGRQVPAADDPVDRSRHGRAHAVLRDPARSWSRARLTRDV